MGQTTLPSQDLRGAAVGQNQLATAYLMQQKYPQALVIYEQLNDVAYEGRVRNNLADTLYQLEHYAQAKGEILQAIECDKKIGQTAAPWKSYNILQNIEMAPDNPNGTQEAAVEAWLQAKQHYLSYRQQEGYPQATAGQLADGVFALLQQGQTQQVIDTITPYLEAQDWQLFVSQLLLVVNGSRNLALADNFELNYAEAVEILFLIERLNGL